MNFSILREYQDNLIKRGVPGNDCTVSVCGREAYRHYAGYSDIEEKKPMRGDELYMMWSASKTITTSLGMKLYEFGAFSMNDRLYDYLPEFRYMSVMRDGAVDDVKNPILIGHLFNMTAGFDYNLGTKYVAEVKKASAGRCPTRDIIRAVSKSPLQSEPGEHYRYSLCHDVLGALIEVVSGKKLRDYARDVLFEPLGMADTTYNMPQAEKTDRMARLYSYREDLGRVVTTNNTCGYMLGADYDSGGAGIVSTCSDLMKFASAITNGGTSADGYRYLSPETVAMWHTNTLSMPQKAEFAVGSMTGYTYGYGVRVREDAGEGVVPAGEFGWGGAAGSWLSMNQKDNIAAVYTQHMLSDDDAYISVGLCSALYKNL